VTSTGKPAQQHRDAAQSLPRDGQRPLRRDAERNRQRILRAAAEVFGERGLDATLDDVAHRAGVGVGTVYRRFPDKESLVGELFHDRIDAMVSVAKEAYAADDPWVGLVSYIEHVSAMMADDLGLRQMLLFATYGRDRVTYAREQMRPVVARLVARAQAAGMAREDLSATDVPMIACMLATVAEYAGAVQPEVWRRYLVLIIDGLRPARDGASPLPLPALTPQQMEQVLRAHAAR
jgi:AcrR family transcriptional regulator